MSIELHPSLFNVHWTCQYCGVLVCFECHEVRQRGSTSYAGKADLARMYRSRRRLGGGRNRDDHMWPLCKRGRVHEITDDTLQLTVMIASGIVAKLKVEMEAIAKEWNIDYVRRLPDIGGKYRVTHLLGKNLPLTWIWDVPPSCLGNRQLQVAAYQLP